MSSAEALAKIRLEHEEDKTTGGALIRLETAFEPFAFAVDKELNDKTMSFPDIMEAYTVILAAGVYALAQQLDENEETKIKFIQQVLGKVLVRALSEEG